MSSFKDITVKKESENSPDYYFKEFKSIIDNIVLLSGQPGNGKSTFAVKHYCFVDEYITDLLFGKAKRKSLLYFKLAKELDRKFKNQFNNYLNLTNGSYSPEKGTLLERRKTALEEFLTVITREKLGREELNKKIKKIVYSIVKSLFNALDEILPDTIRQVPIFNVLLTKLKPTSDGKEASADKYEIKQKREISIFDLEGGRNERTYRFRERGGEAWTGCPGMQYAC